MTIKEQIQKKINDYKEDFYKECGFHLIVIPQVSIAKVPLYEVCTYCCYFLELNESDLHSNRKVAVKAKEFISGLASKMGYREEEIYKALLLDRTSLYKVNKRFREDMTETRSYKYEFYRFMEYLYKQINLSYDKSGTKEWKEKVEYLDLIFLEHIDIEQPVKKKKAPYTVSTGTGAILAYIRENNGSKGKDIVNFLVDNKYYKTRNAAHTQLGCLNRGGKIKRENSIWKIV